MSTAAPHANLGARVSNLDCERTRASIRAALDLLVEPGAVHELRILDVEHEGTVSGYFDDLDAMAEAAARYDGRGAVYGTLNPVIPALIARAANRVKSRAKTTTTDNQILHRRQLLIDVDEVRPPGISSSAREHDAAIARAHEIANYLGAELDWPGLVVADSGNGGHVRARIDLPNDAASARLIERCLAALAFRFSDEHRKVDTTVSNAARICKLYGTQAVKGDNTPERPHRRSTLLYVPDPIETVPIEKLAALASLAPPEAEPRQDRRANGHNDFDLAQWISVRGLEVTRAGPWRDGRRWVLAVCPVNPEHANGEAYIVQFASGAIAAGCQHDSCTWKWADLRERFEPGAYERRATRGDGRNRREDRPPHGELEQRAEERQLRLEEIGFTGDRLRALRDRPQPASPLPGLLDPEPHLHVLLGRPKSAKTTLALAVARAWCLGVDLWPGAPNMPGSRALVISREQAVTRIDSTLRRLTLFAKDGRGDEWADRLMVVGRDRDLPKEGRRLLTLDDGGLDALRAVLLRARDDGDAFGLVALDSVSRLKPPEIEERDNDGMTVWLDELEDLSAASGAYVLAIHHVGHTAEPGRREARGAGRGASAISAVAQVVWLLERVPGNPQQRRLEVDGNAILPTERFFECATADAEPGAVFYFRPAIEGTRFPIEKIAVGEAVSLTELAWRCAGQERQPNKKPPGVALRAAHACIDSWVRAGLGETFEGKHKALMFTRKAT